MIADNKTTNHDYDIIIVGAGLAGASLACALQYGPWKVALLDRHTPQAMPQGAYATRISSVNRASQQFLSDIGVWQKLDQSRIHWYPRVEVCQAHSDANLSFDIVDQPGAQAMGHMIENEHLVTAMHQCLLGHAYDDGVTHPVERLLGYDIKDIEWLDNGVRLSVNDAGQTLSAGLIIGADGPQSFVRRSAKVEVTKGSYQQTCIVANIKISGEHRQIAWQKFLETGPIGVLPLGESHFSLAWSNVQSKADELLAMDSAQFLSELQSHLPDYFGDVLSIESLSSYPLWHQHAQHYFTRHMALLGDAAHAIHPLAGLGANLALRDSAVLAQQLYQSAQGSNSVSHDHFHAMQAYERRCRAHNEAFLQMMSVFNYSFGQQSLVPHGLRSLFISMTDKLTPIKRQLMDFATGMDQQRPRLDQYLKPKNHD